jgi:PAS domain S-box-containing protein
MDSASEVKRLQHCMNDLVSVLALPAAWSGSEPSRILETFLDALQAMLDLDFLYVRVRLNPREDLIDALRTAQFYRTNNSEDKIRHALNQWSGEHPQQWSQEVLRRLEAPQEISVFPLRMGVEGELGLIVAGSQRAGFPEQIEKLILNVAANQTAVGLQQAVVLSEQKRIARDLDRRVADRTRELAEINEALQLQAGLLQHLPVVAWTLRPDGTPDFINQVWLEYSSQTLAFVCSHPEAWMTAVHPDDRETAASIFWEGVRTGQSFAMETRFLRAQDGTYRWHLNQAVVLRGADGKVLKFVGTSTDIDDQKRAEEVLRASETDLRQVLNSIPGMVAVVDTNGEVAFLSKPVIDYYGKPQGEINNQWMTGDLIHSEDRTGFIQAFTQSLASGDPTEIELRARRFDGVYRWFKLRGRPLRDRQSRIVRWYFLQTDIDDRKRAEDELRRSEARHRVVVEAASDAVVSIDENGAIILANPATKPIFGYSPEDLIGKPLTVLMPGAMRGLHEKGFKRYLDTGAKQLNWQGTEVTALRANGEEFPAEVSFGEMTLDRRKIFTGFIRDISGKKRADEELRNTQAELARMMRVMTIGQLTASIAHEVSQPLSGIITNTSTCVRMLNSNPPDVDGARETAKRTMRDGKRATDVIARLRTLLSKRQINIEPVDVNEAAREVLALLSGELQKRDLLLLQQFNDNLPHVMGDRVQLQQVILNLLRNASDAMEMVTDRPRSLLIRTETDNNSVRLSVQDSGVGFDPRITDRLFESFFTTKQEGMGIGLSVSRSIVEAHHGKLWATRNDGPGATFAFSIPYDDSPTMSDG